MTLKEQVEALEKRLILKAAKSKNSSLIEIQQTLGLSPQGLKNKLNRYGIEVGETRAKCSKCGRPLPKVDARALAKRRNLKACAKCRRRRTVNGLGLCAFCSDPELIKPAAQRRDLLLSKL